MTIVVTGGSGYLGTELTKALLSKKCTVIVIDTKGPRFVHKNLFYIPCDLDSGDLPFNVLERTDAIIHLKGASLFATEHLIQSLEQTTNKPTIVISASSTFFYGSDSEKTFDEKSPAGEGALPESITEIEKEITRAEEFGCRVVIVRTATILGREGILKPLWRLSRLHLTSTLTKKDFWMPWIHISDLVRAYLFALDTGTLQGVVNAAAPLPWRHSDIVAAFKKITKSFSLGAITRLFVGKKKKEILFEQKISPQRLNDKGFVFTFTNPQDAIKELKQHAKG